MAARRSEDRGSNSSLEFVWVRLNGSDSTIEGALRTIQGMRNASTQRQFTGKGNGKALPEGKNGSSKEPEAADTLFDEQQEEVEAEVVDAHSDPAAPRVPRKTRLPKGIPNLDFDSETPTFREFVAEKKPSDQFDWYLLVASWLKKHKQTEEIGLPHVVTAKQYMGADWSSLPVDAGQPFRDGRRPSHGIFEKGSKNGLSKITANGEIRVGRLGQTAKNE